MMKVKAAVVLVAALAAVSLVAGQSAAAIGKVEGLIAGSPVTIFSKSYCPHSRMANKLVSSIYPDVKIIQLDLEEDGADMQDVIKAKYNHYTVPAVFIDQVLVGGNDSVQELHEEGALVDMINEASGAEDLRYSAVGKLEALIAANPVTIFSKSYCPHSRAANKLVSSIYPDVKIIQLDLEEDGADLQDVIKTKYNHYTVPAVFIGQMLIGGNDSVQELAEKGGLVDMINQASGGEDLW